MVYPLPLLESIMSCVQLFLVQPGNFYWHKLPINELLAYPACLLQTYFNPEALDLVRMLITGGCTPELE